MEDVAEAIILATENFNQSDPVNIGTGKNISIKNLAYTIAEIIEFSGEIKWDTSKPNGQNERQLNTTLAKEKFGFEFKTNLYNGLKKTIEWYIQEQKKI